MRRLLIAAVLVAGGCASSQVEPNDGLGYVAAIVDVDHDDVVIDEAFVSRCKTHSFTVRFGGSVVADAAGDGVIKITASDVTVDFEGTLNGAATDAVPDTFAGTGVRVEGARNVHVRGLRVGGYKVGLRATNADGLEMRDCLFDNLWRMHLKSTKEKEHNDDWLWPHENDKQEWVTNYGAAACIERSGGVKVQGVKVRRGQNGIILDRVEQGMLYDNDCSFLSGWGIAMWRSSKNLISRNALDFCVRGYSHGKYNRGQDSAGLLMFEQCSGNTVVENSITHCGDGVFVFAGKEALGEKKPEERELDYARLGCNDNVFARNDLSFAPAHGLEVTFSFGNRIEENLVEGNAICGIWGGYSQETLVSGNKFYDNGARGAGEGGGVNIEHGYRNTVERNRFVGNSVALKLWDDDDGALLKTPWAVANHRGSRENRFFHNGVAQKGGAALWVRKSLETEVTDVTVRSIAGEAVQTVDSDDASTFAVPAPDTHLVAPQREVVAIGDTRPVGVRDQWWGREWIVMDEWGPIVPTDGARTGVPRGVERNDPWAQLWNTP
ncbi:MAG: right-handed parallel beta-helix repeat-containing protein [Phycisphaerales bacterium]